MSPAARSVQVFGVYLAALGMLLMVAPNLLLSVFGIAPTGEVWIRVVGMLALLLGFYYLRAAGRELTEFFAWTVLARASVPLFFAAFVWLDGAPPMLLLFAAVDAAGAAWTWAALRTPRSGV